MAKKTVVNLTATGEQIANAIRASAPYSYQAAVPVATSTNSVSVGEAITSSRPLASEFIGSLVNRIALTWITSKGYSNPLSFFKKGMLELGDSVEEIHVNLVAPKTFDSSIEGGTVFKRTPPDFSAALHKLNWQKYYPQTIENSQLRQAFLSWDKLEEFIAALVNSMYNSLNYDEFLTMKYIIAKEIYDGNLFVAEISGDSPTAAAVSMKGISNALTFMSSEYNAAGVPTYTDKNDQFLLMSSSFEAQQNVEVLAAAFNMSKAEFEGHRVLVDSFGALDIERLNKLLGENEGYYEFSSSELEELDKIPAVLVDRNFFMIFDQLLQFTEIENPEGLYWNYFLHSWKVMSVSPFCNAVVFNNQPATVESVTVSPNTQTGGAGTYQFSAAVATTGYASKKVNWSVDSDGATINQQGLLTVSNSASGSITVTATSTFDPEKSGTATFTVE